MAQDTFTLYKLIVLYMLNRAAFPVTKAQISDFMLEKEYTNFLTLQQVISDLIDAEMVMITAETVHNRTYLAITEEGRKTLSFFHNQINSSTKQEIDEFFRENEMEMRNELSILSDYYKSASGEYESHLTAADKGSKLVDITLTVPDEAIAASICENWQKKNQAVYQYLIEQLF